MNYVVFDLEFNQRYENNTTNNENKELNNTPRLTFEIIQIGAIKLNENFEKISTFNNLIKPLIHTNLHPYVENLTKITSEDLNCSKEFTEVYEDFIKFVGDEEAVFCVWGAVDIKELIRNVKFHKLPVPSIPIKYIDIQRHASKYFHATKGNKIGLKTAIELLNIELTGEFHDAFNDAYYTSEILKAIYNEDIKPLIYKKAPPNRTPMIKEIVDIVAVFEQFEKMYHRPLSEEEKSMINLAYTMGRTRQFLVAKAEKH